MECCCLGIVVATLTLVLITKLWQICWFVSWRPYALTKSFDKQGIKGPRYSIPFGSLAEMKKLKKVADEMVLEIKSNDITQKVLPHHHTWSSQYGETILFWYGPWPVITIADPELAKQVLSNKFGIYVSPKLRFPIDTLMGKGLILLNGLDWVRHRTILNNGFTMDKLKGMIGKMAACSLEMTDEWKNQANFCQDQCIEIDMNEEFQKLTADIIAHTAFGSSYVQGKEAFKAQKQLEKCCVALSTSIFIPGNEYLPTPSNLRIWNLDRKVKNTLRQIIESRIKSQAEKASTDRYGYDVLGLMIESSETTDAKDSPKLNMDEIIEECKTFFFAGQETTSNLLTWTIFILSLHQEWQQRLRQEVLKECGMGIPNADMLAKLRLLNVVLLETLRLYCPVIDLIREASQETKLGNLIIPKGMFVTIPVVRIHRSTEYWGEDANEFNPLRFMNGVSQAAKHPNALLPFGIGPKACIGQNFAMLEAKTVLVLLLQMFSFSLSPEYKHRPTHNLTLQPQHGLPIIVKLLHL